MTGEEHLIHFLAQSKASPEVVAVTIANLIKYGVADRDSLVRAATKLKDNDYKLMPSPDTCPWCRGTGYNPG